VTRDHRINAPAFGGRTEAWLVQRLRGSAGTSSLVAVDADAVVGHPEFSAAEAVGDL
jgi:predicted N-acetyltransferase YhbS